MAAGEDARTSKKMMYHSMYDFRIIWGQLPILRGGSPPLKTLKYGFIIQPSLNSNCNEQNLMIVEQKNRKRQGFTTPWNWKHQNKQPEIQNSLVA
jgi:hypothetical protein